jgi:two-component system OmpR family response regulator
LSAITTPNAGLSPDAEPISVILVESDERLARVTANYLEAYGIVVTIATEGRNAVARVVHGRPDVVLLDVRLPGLGGLAVCKELRAKLDTRIIILTARGDEADRVSGLESGADDYIEKPVSPRELLARIRAQTRRGRGVAGPARPPLNAGRLTIEADGTSALLDGKKLVLTAYELTLLRALAERPGRVLTREQLVEIVRGNAEDAFDRSVDVHISHVRAKLGDDSRNPRLIKTVRGVGYMLAVERS